MEHPATKLVHWPTKPIMVCDAHAAKLEKLAEILGYHIGIGEADLHSQCANCVNEAKRKS